MACYHLTARDFHPGLRVALHPATDRWMMGDRYGVVVKSSGVTVTVTLDRSGKTLKFAPCNLSPL